MKRDAAACRIRDREEDDGRKEDDVRKEDDGRKEDDVRCEDHGRKEDNRRSEDHGRREDDRGCKKDDCGSRDDCGKEDNHGRKEDDRSREGHGRKEDDHRRKEDEHGREEDRRRQKDARNRHLHEGDGGGEEAGGDLPGSDRGPEENRAEGAEWRIQREGPVPAEHGGRRGPRFRRGRRHRGYPGGYAGEPGRQPAGQKRRADPGNTRYRA